MREFSDRVAVVTGAASGVKRNARRVRVGADAVAIDLVQRLAPTGYQRIVTAAARRRAVG